MANENDVVVLNNGLATTDEKGKAADLVMNQFNDLISKGQLTFPADYNVGNAVKYAALVISQNPDFRTCTKASVIQAISDMALQGLYIDKKQGYFIKFGNEIKFFRSYFGDIAAVLRTGLVKDIKAVIVYEGDQFETGIENDEEVVLKHTTSFLNRDNPIIGTYAVAILPEGAKRYCIMTKKEIQANWNKSRSKDHSTHEEFPQEMAKRTVIRRLVKIFFNSANTIENFSASLIAAFNRTSENEYEQAQVVEKKNDKTNIDIPDIIDSDND